MTFQLLGSNVLPFAAVLLNAMNFDLLYMLFIQQEQKKTFIVINNYISNGFLCSNSTFRQNNLAKSVAIVPSCTMQFSDNGVICETSLKRFFNISIITANKIRYTTFRKNTDFHLWTQELCFRNNVQFILFTVTIEIVQNHVSDISHITEAVGS